mmetsp:Transcript_14944/g.26556  ORF Transcript_14944/g.26556 Transcript_14944/m.26556 type:complete len:106 (-) Transcript_14944:65-382(-)
MAPSANAPPFAADPHDEAADVEEPASKLEVCDSTVNLESGAVTVFPMHPANPPHISEKTGWGRGSSAVDPVTIPVAETAVPRYRKMSAYMPTGYYLAIAPRCRCR